MRTAKVLAIAEAKVEELIRRKADLGEIVTAHAAEQRARETRERSETVHIRRELAALSRGHSNRRPMHVSES